MAMVLKPMGMGGRGSDLCLFCHNARQRARLNKGLRRRRVGMNVNVCATMQEETSSKRSDRCALGLGLDVVSERELREKGFMGVISVLLC